MAPKVDSGKKRGRPPTGISKPIGLRLYVEQQAALDAWIEQQGSPRLSRPEAIRRLIYKGLAQG